MLSDCMLEDKLTYVLPTLQEPPDSLMQCEPDITVTNTPCHYITRKKMECHIRSYVPDRCMGHRHKFPVMIGA